MRLLLLKPKDSGTLPGTFPGKAKAWQNPFWMPGTIFGVSSLGLSVAVPGAPMASWPAWPPHTQSGYQAFAQLVSISQYPISPTIFSVFTLGFQLKSSLLGPREPMLLSVLWKDVSALLALSDSDLILSIDVFSLASAMTVKHLNWLPTLRNWEISHIFRMPGSIGTSGYMPCAGINGLQLKSSHWASKTEADVLICCRPYCSLLPLWPEANVSGPLLLGLHYHFIKNGINGRMELMGK